MKIKSFLASFLAIFMLSMSGAWADSVVNPIDQVLERQGYLIKVDRSSCWKQCSASYQTCLASCDGLNSKGGFVHKSDKGKCQDHCSSARRACDGSC